MSSSFLGPLSYHSTLPTSYNCRQKIESAERLFPCPAITTGCQCFEKPIVSKPRSASSLCLIAVFSCVSNSCSLFFMYYQNAFGMCSLSDGYWRWWAPVIDTPHSMLKRRGLSHPPTPSTTCFVKLSLALLRLLPLSTSFYTVPPSPTWQQQQHYHHSVSSNNIRGRLLQRVRRQRRDSQDCSVLTTESGDVNNEALC